MSHGLRWPSELDVNKTTARIVDTTARTNNAGNRGLDLAVRLRVAPTAPAADSKPQAAIAPHPKYGNVVTDGEASKKQAKRLSELRLMNEAGLIRGLCRQPEYVLIPKQVRESGELIERKMTYVADFQYEEWTANGWRMVVEDAKGYATPGYIQKRKLMLRIHGIEVRET